MPLDLILDSLRAPGTANPRNAAERAFQAIQKRGLLCEALIATEAADAPGVRWLHALLAAEAGVAGEGLDALWARVVDEGSRDYCDVLVQRARLAWRGKKTAAARQLLRQALFCEWDAGALVRMETLAKKVFAAAPFRRTVRIALLAGSNTMMLRSALQLLCWRDRLQAEFYEPDFGTYLQEIRDPDSKLYGFRPDFAVILQNWRDAAMPASDLWNTMLSRFEGAIIQTTFARPPFDAAMGLSLRGASGLARTLDERNREMAARAPERVLLVDTDALAARTPALWEDPKQWTANRIYPSLEALPLLAEAIQSNIRYACGFSSKLLAVDLDNTLWRGVIGEDGMGGIQLGPPSPEGERFQIFQQYLKSLSERGILLAAVSKNNREDAERVFREHDAAVLRLEDFTAFEANWGTKAESLRRIAAGLRLGLDSFVFLDDNPVERAAVRAELPEVAVPNISGEPAESIAALERFQFFQTAALTDEDRNRTASYRALAAAADSTSEELLASLQIEITTGPVDETTASRVTQLINKTNQFNLTTRRYTAADVAERMSSPAYWFRWFKLKDRFADHGLVGLMLAEGADTPHWRVDLWLMSCRVIGRKLEEFMSQSLMDAARAAGALSVRAEYVPTEKNAMVKDLLPRMGFDAVPGSATEFEIDPAAVCEARA
jgi:FkbH-like protein